MIIYVHSNSTAGGSVIMSANTTCCYVQHNLIVFFCFTLLTIKFHMTTYYCYYFRSFNY